MKKSFVLIAAIVAVVGLGAVVAAAKQTTNVGTSVKLEFRHSHQRPTASSPKKSIVSKDCKNSMFSTDK